MSDCIQQSDQHINNSALPSDSKSQGLVRSSSASSSSSFDSCSDLLGSLEHAQENLDDQVKCTHAEPQENEPKCGVADAVVCDQALQSRDVPPGVALQHATEDLVTSSLTPAEVKDDSGKMEGLSMKDHVYGFSNAISFGMVRSLAENTVERISQLQTTFRLPTSYIFPSKNVVPSSNPVLPDAKSDVQIEVSNSCEEQPVEGKDTSGEVLESNSDSERTPLTDTSSLLQKVVGNAVSMACGTLSNKSYPSVRSADLHAEGFSSQEKVGMSEQTSTSEEKTDPLTEKLSACNSMPVVDTIDVSTEDHTPVNNSLSVMGNNDMRTKDVVSNTRIMAIDSMPIVGTNDESIVNGIGNSDMVSCKLLGTESVSTSDSPNLLVGNSVPVKVASCVTAIDASENESQLTGKVKPVTVGHDAPTVDSHLRNSTYSAELVEARKYLTNTPKHSDLGVAAPKILPQNARGLDIVLEDAPCLPHLVKQDSDLPHLENSIISFDLRQKNPVISHPLRTLSSGSGRPDLEEVDDEQDITLGSKQSSGWNFGSTKARMLANGHQFELFDNALNSEDVLLGEESHTWVDRKANKPKGCGWPSSLDHVPKGNLLDEQGLQVVSSSVSNNVNEGRTDDPSIVAGALEELEPGYRQDFLSQEQLCGDILQEDRWKGLSVHLERDPFERGEKEDLGPDELFRYVESLELNESYVDTVLDMEDVLLNYDDSGSRERFLLASSNSVIGTPRSSRDGSLSSSTSALQLLTSGDCTPFTVDWVEVVGAKQRKGGSSFGERIVGVKDHTVYCIKVSSGSQEWEVLRRYRDFVDLYHQLRRKFNVRTERSLPSPWKEIDRDSRKVFGSTHPNVIEIRSTRIEECLQSLLQAGPPLSTSSPLYWFLSPPSTSKSLFSREGNRFLAFAASQKGLDVQLGTIESPCIQSPRSEVGSLKSELDHDKSSLALGKTVKLNLKIHPNKNLKQLLSVQHHSCAGCYKHLEVERGLVQGFVQTLGWGKPRLCEYSGQLYCASCHLNETAVLPAYVLWHWDFTPRRVSQLAKAYLDSIYDQPMLCVSAVNPYLYSRVPILSHVKETRKKLSRMLSCMLCPSRTRIFQTMASRRYLLENNDFFALRDLEDLSKGAFAVLPGLLTAVMESLKLHITKQCSVCSETGEWCGSGILCEEPFSPIFPFQEENIATCKVCHTPFHKPCFSKDASCPACPKNHGKRLGFAREFEQPSTEEFSEDRIDGLSSLGGQDVTASPPSMGDIDLEGQLVTEKQSSSYRNWPSFYRLLPKKRLW